MHTIKRTCHFAILTLTVVAAPVFAQSVEVSASTGLNPAKYAQRVKDLGEQIRLVRSKGLITEDDATKFSARNLSIHLRQFQKKFSDYVISICPRRAAGPPLEGVEAV
jgi:hypothetical protein